jgi:arsenite-transporting ATPase
LTVREPVGEAALADLAGALYGSVDPSAVLHTGPRAEVVATGDGHELRMPLPDCAADDGELLQRGDELHVTVGGYTRNLVLPAALRAHPVTSANVTDGWLAIGFDRPAPVAAGGRAASA